MYFIHFVDFSNSQNPKPTSEDNKPKGKKKKKNPNQATIPNKNIKPKCALVLRSTNASHFGAEIVISKFRFLLRCQNIMNLWVQVVALVLRFNESMGKV